MSDGIPHRPRHARHRRATKQLPEIPDPSSPLAGPGRASSGYRVAGYPVRQGLRDPEFRQGFRDPEFREGFRDPEFRGPAFMDDDDGGPVGLPPIRGAGSRLGDRSVPGRSMPGRRRVRLVIVIAAACSLAAIGGALYAVIEHGSLGAAGHVSSSPPARQRPPAADIHKGDLRRYLLAAPGGSHPWPSPLGTDRTLSLRQVASLSTNSTKRTATLRADQFTRGAVQCWITRSGTWVDVRLYQFGSAADAQTFFRSDVAASARTSPASAQSSVSGVPGARAFAASKPDHSGYVAVLIIGVKGDVTFIVDIAEHSAKAHLASPDSLTQAEYGNL